MPLTTLTSADTFIVVETKLDAAIDKVNEIDLNITGGTTRQRLEKTSGTDYAYDWVSDTKDINLSTWNGTQPMSSSYVIVGTISYTTPNDGISRYYQIIEEADSRIELDATAPTYKFRLYNSTDALELVEKSLAWNEPTGTVGSFIVNPQNTIIYSGVIAPNKTIELQTKYGTNTTTMDVKAGTLSMIEIYKI